MFSRSILGEKNRKYESGGRKSTYWDETDLQHTAKEIISGLNLLSRLLIYHKYIDEVGKQSRRWFSATVWAKKIGNVDPRDENRHIVMRTIPTYRQRSQIGFKSSLNASNISQIHRSSRKIIETMFFSSILGEKNAKYESGVRKSTYCNATDFQPTAQQYKLCLNPLPFLLIYHKYMHEVGKLSGRFFPAEFSAKIIRNKKLGNENRYIVIRPISNLPLKK